MAQVTVTIIGLGRLGASVGLAIKRIASKEHKFTVVGTDTNAQNLQTAHKMKAIDVAERHLDTAVQNADLVIIAAAYELIEDIYSAIGEVMRPGAVVIDTSPLKLPSIAWAQEHFKKDADNRPEVYLVGAVPVVNPAYLEDVRNTTESASADLFDKGLFILAPAADCPNEAIKLATDFVGLLGVQVRFIDPVEHDGIVAATQGLPALLQLAFFRTLYLAPSWDDMRKLTNSQVGLATYLLDQNRAQDLAALVYRNKDNVLRTVNALIAQLDELRDILTKGDELDLAQVYADGMSRYVLWRSARDKNDWDDMPKAPEFTPTLMGGLLGRRKPKDDATKSRD
ncbi:MAG TPA: prephenate dehydrogenase/arogenate dehydrogenase family protein [Aggregatilineales bacterium]|nr:prephenate dehydrogenase/arogenate dehydrogenase family protein [Aggregatilineales bacterium]